MTDACIALSSHAEGQIWPKADFPKQAHSGNPKSQSRLLVTVLYLPFFKALSYYGNRPTSYLWPLYLGLLDITR